MTLICYKYLIIMAKRQADRLSEDEAEWKVKEEADLEKGIISSSNRKESKSDIYKCGDAGCGKFYHSYTAFYNHCKKSHNGQFPANSIHNNKIFEGPSKNRGRPRIKKNDTKDEGQIQAMKRQNELIEFLGTLKSRKNEEHIVYVENPLERLEGVCVIVEDWLAKSQDLNEARSGYLRSLDAFNRLVDINDLPQFYDPIEADRYRDKLDSYNFSSIQAFMTNPVKKRHLNINFEGHSLLYRILVVWLSRILSEKLLAEVVYTILQIEFGCDRLRERQLLQGRAEKLRQSCQRYFQCFLGDGEQPMH